MASEVLRHDCGDLFYALTLQHIGILNVHLRAVGLFHEQYATNLGELSKIVAFWKKGKQTIHRAWRLQCFVGFAVRGHRWQLWR